MRLKQAGAGRAEVSTAAVGASAASQTGARPKGWDAAAPGLRSPLREGLKGARGLGTLWRPLGPGKGPHGRGQPGAASRRLAGSGRAPGLLPYRRFAAGNSRQVLFVEEVRATELGLREGRGGGAASSSPLRCPGVGGRQ